ncbi:acyltransferase family protein [Phytohabitans houttuyneae]|uniref:Acyltransferase n=1 Tax=Phytohabitans houttuyneae TaxID=1076126 RepID=A0A6V8KM01_9ACTN|nr:acyltransferase [Phytohabitans houttuyneae]GFJ86173.1 acyltransferase [Phytohabitans houttuyneae]
MNAGFGSSQPRDRAIDTIRAVAICGVVVGHWLVTGLVLGPGGGLDQASPLRALPSFAPVTWVLQTLGLFFFAGGYAAARSRRPLGRRLLRLALPVAGFGALWTLVLVLAAAAGVPAVTIDTVDTLVVSPLWFLLPFVALLALTGPLRRVGPLAALPAVAVVGLADAGLGALPLTVLAAWLVPYTLGMALATGRLGGRGTGIALLGGGALAMVVLIRWLDYPMSAVGVPGEGRSNLSPPSLFTVALGTAQIGVALLVRPWLNRRPAPPAVAALNRAAMPIYLWHQSALIAVVAGMAWLTTGAPVPGLHTAPDGLSWVAARALWFPVFATVLAAACAVFPDPTGRADTARRPIGQVGAAGARGVR